MSLPLCVTAATCVGLHFMDVGPYVRSVPACSSALPRQPRDSMYPHHCQRSRWKDEKRCWLLNLHSDQESRHCRPVIRRSSRHQPSICM